MRVRVHADNSRDKDGRFRHRRWMLLTPQDHRAVALVSAETALLSQVELTCARRSGRRGWSSGWALGELVATRGGNRCRNGDHEEMIAAILEREEVDLDVAPELGWRRLRFLKNEGFGLGETVEEARAALILRASWMLVTPRHSYAIF